MTNFRGLAAAVLVIAVPLVILAVDTAGRLHP